VADGEIWRLATSVFVHADGVHLLVNALALLSLGWILEPRIGTARWLAWFAAGGIAGSTAAFVAGSAANGASGGVFALVAAGAIVGLRTWGTLSRSERTMWGPVLWIALAVGWLSTITVPAIDPYAHLGGFAAGVVAGLVFRRGSVQARRSRTQDDAEV
jgi:rhomboid protease GluP